MITDIGPIIAQYINPKAIAIAVVLTQLIRYVLPSEEGGCSASVSGWSKRLLPIMPLVFGMIFCGLIERDSSYVLEDLLRGIFSGTMASYSYSLVKVSFFGR